MTYSLNCDLDADQYLNFILDESSLSPNHSNIFINNPEVVKIEQENCIMTNINQNKVKINKNSINSKELEHRNPHIIKKKQFHHHKMIHLINPPQSDNHNLSSNPSPSDDPTLNLNLNHKQKNLLTRDQQLRRNRQSAKHSRLRRKQYIKTLELQNQENQKKIIQLTIKLNTIELQRNRLKQQNRSFMKTFMTTKNQTYQNLSNILTHCTTTNRSNDQLSQQLQIIISRYGVAGSQRFAASDYFMKQIIQILLADIHKYIVDCVVNNCGLFGLGKWSKFDEQICKILKINKQFRNKLTNNYNKQMIEEFQMFQLAIRQFYHAYREVQNQAKKIQKLFQRIYLQFNDVSIAQLILWLQQNKFSKQLKRIRSDWILSVEKSIENTINRGRKRQCSMSL